MSISKFDQKKLCKYSILIVEDDLALQEVLVLAAEERGISALVASDGSEAVMKAQAQRFDALLVDMNLPKKRGYDVVNDVKSSGLSQRSLIFVLSGYLTKEVVGAVAGKIEKAFTKPADIDLVMETIHAALELKSAKKVG